ncbi:MULTISPECIES: ABC transporter permease [Pseudomonas]|uniref:ABC transporter permease n=1 Tax=Pseudomonas eucalypticola TaxID=2599595 RepID=A0A7D5HEQ9_9PSED|nr:MULTISPECIES: ABC transporter permease [Pseudomonas]QKZ05690.1 ABC transporter permease [Pseudomonas eucalypticola]
MPVDRAQAVHRPRRLVPAPLGKGASLLGPCLLLVAWELAAQLGWLSPKVLAPPSTALTTGYRLLADGVLWPHLLASARRALSGLAIGVTLGLVLALVAGLTRLGDALIDGVVQIKRAIPTLSLIPLAILWLGIGDGMKITLIAGGVCLPVYLGTHAALKGIDLRYVELAHTLDLDRWTFIRKVAVPGALPGFFVGLRFAVTICWGALVVLEQINTTQGIGYLMNRARDYGQTDVIVVGLVTYMVLGLVCDRLVRVVEYRVLRYRKVIGS